ncbi:SCO family protein [Planctomicrobium sp. SH664]|uniref:SCO family protein n=1 Tax=Planctomicrobium sp. SH664 TaxID=3448125 RepID=UPI003F5B8190
MRTRGGSLFTPGGVIPVCLLAVLVMSRVGVAQPASPASEIGFDQHLGAQIPLELEFQNSSGEKVRLADYFGKKPVIITPVYYKCPMLCSLELNGLVRCLRAMKLDVGKDFDIVTVSISPEEKSPLANQKRKQYLAQYGREGAENGWHFLTGEQEPITKLCETVGFKSKFDPATQQYAHAAGIVICTPEGKISRYLFGVEFVPRDLRLAIVESSKGTVGTLTDQAMLFCYMYDPTRGKYGLAILNIIRTGGVVTLLALVTGVYQMLRRERLTSQPPKVAAGASYG